MDETSKCPTCGSPLSADAPAGLCLRCLGRLAASSLEPAEPRVEGAADAAGVPAEIRHLGDYELIERLGRGGMGVVYRAWQLSLNRPVAVKMISAGGLADPEAVGRFRAEAEAAARLRHPHIVAIYEVGEHRDQPFFAMELVEGRNLAELTRDVPLPPVEAARLLVCIARAVQHAHDRGVLHRDLKPQNVLVDEWGEPHLTDFGLALRLDSPEGFTNAGQALGTPGYVAPEQAVGGPRAGGIGSDVYSLGAIFYHLVTTLPPVVADTPAQALKAMLEKAPVSPRLLNRSLPRDLETSCLQCLATDSKRRYASAGELAEDLERWLQGQPILARPVGPGERLWLWARRRPALAALSALLALTVAGGATAVIWEWRNAEAHRRRAEFATEAMRQTSDRLYRQEAERQLGEHRTEEGLALLALSARLDPTNPAAVSRLISVLSRPTTVFPATPAMQDGAKVAFATLSPEGDHVVIGDLESRVRVWDSRTGLPLSEPRMDPGRAAGIEFTADGKAFMTFVPDRCISFWSLPEAKLAGRNELPGVTTATLHPTNSLVAAGLANGDIQVFDRLQPERRWQWHAHEGPLTALEFSRAENFLVSASSHGPVRVWAASPPFGLSVELPHDRAVTALHLSPDGLKLLTLDAASTPRLWRLPSGLRIATLALSGECTAWAFTAHSTRLLLGTSRGAVLVFHAPSGQRLLRYTNHTDKIFNVASSPDGTMAVSASQDGTAQVWDMHTGQPVCQPLRHSFWVTAAQFTPDGRRILTASMDDTARVWEPRRAPSAVFVFREPDAVQNLAFVAGGSQLVTVTADGGVRVRNPRTGALLRTLRQPALPLERSVFTRSATLLAVADTNHLVSILPLEGGPTVTMSARPSSSVICLDFSADGRRLALSAENHVFVCDTASGRVLAGPLVCASTNALFLHRVLTLSFSPDGRRLLTGCYGGHALLWEVDTGRILADLRHEAGVAWTEFSPEGERFLTASIDRTAKLWSTTNPTAPPRILSQRDALSAATFSPDGRRALTCAFDGTAMIWDTETGAHLVTPMSHGARVLRGRFDPAGARVLTWSDDGTFRLWDARTGLPLGDPHPVGARPSDVAVTPLWDAFAVATGTPEVRVWRDPPLPSPAPDWLLALAEGLAGRRFDASLTEDTVSASAFLDLQARLLAAPPTDAWSKWAHWFLAPPGERPRSWDEE